MRPAAATLLPPVDLDDEAMPPAPRTLRSAELGEAAPEPAPSPRRPSDAPRQPVDPFFGFVKAR